MAWTWWSWRSLPTEWFCDCRASFHATNSLKRRFPSLNQHQEGISGWQGCSASFPQDRLSLREVPACLLTAHCASSRSSACRVSSQASVILMDNSPLWLNTLSVPSGGKGANAAHRPYLTDRPCSGLQPAGNSQWKPRFITIVTACRISPVRLFRREKKLFVTAPHISLHSLRGKKQNRTR